MDPQPPERSNLVIALLAGMLIAGSAVGVMLWQLSQKEKAVAVRFGLDSLAPRDGSQTAPVQLAAPRSGLDMINIGAAPSGKGEQLPSGGGSPLAAENARPTGTGLPSAPSAVPAFTEALRKSEAKARDLAIKYTERYPAMLQYGRDWMGKPDLKKLNDDYMADHDPVKFLRGLARSPSFPELTAKYARDPAVQAFVKEALKEAPRDVLAASSDLLVEDGVLRGLLSDAGQALGLPQSFTDGLKDYGKKPQAPAPAQPGR